MSATASLIQSLHRITRQKKELHQQLDRGPKRIAAMEAKLKQAESLVQLKKEQLTKAKMDAHSKQLQMNEREQKLVTLQGKLNVAKENREYQTLKDQIAADKQANLVLSDEILELLESIDAQVIALKDSEREVQVVRDELSKVTKEVADRRLVLETDLSRVQAELDKTEAQLSGDLKREYLRMVTSRGDDAMAELEGKCCGGCYQSLTLSLLDRLLMKQTVLCPSCGRLVYQDQDR